MTGTIGDLLWNEICRLSFMHLRRCDIVERRGIQLAVVM
jgi:hypothetical protein